MGHPRKGIDWNGPKFRNCHFDRARSCLLLRSEALPAFSRNERVGNKSVSSSDRSKYEEFKCEQIRSPAAELRRRLRRRVFGIHVLPD